MIVMVNPHTRILIIDDHVLFADGLMLILQSLGDNVAVAVSNDAYSVLNDQSMMLHNDLILIDLHMPDFNGFAFLAAVQSQSLPVKVAVISGTENKAEIEKAIGLGACGFIPKDSGSQELLKAVSMLLAGKRYLPLHWDGEIDWLPGSQPETSEDAPLTKRQMEVLTLMRDGLQNKQIAAVLGVSVSSVKGHIELLFKNLQVNNRTSCVQVARDKGLVD